MIKEIVEEYNKQNRINVLTLLEQIKNLEYEITGIYKDKLIHKSEKENLKVLIDFSFKKIISIDIYTSSGWGDESIMKIDTGLNSKGVTLISQELYNRYFGVNK